MMTKLLKRLRRDKRGQGLVEYGLIIAGVALVTAAAISIFGHKTSDLVAAVASILPGAHSDDNAPIVSGHMIETTPGAVGAPIKLDVQAISGASGQSRLSNNIMGNNSGVGNGFGGLVVDPGSQ